MGGGGISRGSFQTPHHRAELHQTVVLQMALMPVSRAIEWCSLMPCPCHAMPCHDMTSKSRHAMNNANVTPGWPAASHLPAAYFYNSRRHPKPSHLRRRQSRSRTASLPTMKRESIPQTPDAKRRQLLWKRKVVTTSKLRLISGTVPFFVDPYLVMHWFN